ncbi:MAG: AAA family ATPase [Planctomycetota bacterium]|nr:AAA family ATPase [Planctomycetota bacterium]
MGLTFSVSSIEISGGQEIPLSPDDLLVVVGPNNSGKSSLLREIKRYARDHTSGPVVNSVAFSGQGDPGELQAWFAQNTWQSSTDVAHRRYHWFNANVPVNGIPGLWQQREQGCIGALAEFFCSLLDTEERLKVGNPIGSFALLREPPKHPIHALYSRDELEKKASKYFHEAFGQDLIVNRGAGGEIPLHCGRSPTTEEGEDRVSPAYLARLAEVPLLHEQGDGMRSFAGCLLYFLTSPAFVQLIDEPEAFLHPRQARLIGELLAREKPDSRQLLIATHSGDLLRGILDASPAKLKVLRLTREGEANTAHCLEAGEIRELWENPVLRFSNVLDGLFCESVVICEEETDCRFYAAIADAVRSTQDGLSVRPDLMFTACAGKTRIPLVARSLQKIGVTTRAIVDFDIMAEEHTLKQTVDALGGDWETIQQNWRTVKQSIEQKGQPLRIDHVRQEIDLVLSREEGETVHLSENGAERIKEVLRAGSAWREAKRSGKSYVPSGQARQALDQLLADLRGIGLFVVDVGELERFVPSVGNHGWKWLAEVLEKDLRADSLLREAREFVSQLLDSLSPSSPVAGERSECDDLD